MPGLYIYERWFLGRLCAMPTLFLIHTNELLQISSIHCYADKSTSKAFYTGRANI